MGPTACTFTGLPQVVTVRLDKYTPSGGHGSKGLRAGRCIETAGPFRVADEEGGPGKGVYFIPAALVKYATNVFIPPLAWPQS